MVISSSKAALPKQKRLERDIVIIPPEFDEFDQDITMTIYGDKVAFIDYAKENSIIIENPMIADFERKFLCSSIRSYESPSSKLFYTTTF